MFELIVACGKDNGIGLKGALPWKIPKEMELFREKTRDSVLIVGRKTAESLPHLKDRLVYCLSQTKVLTKDANQCKVFDSLTDAVIDIEQNYPGKKVFIAGGECLYGMVLEYFPSMINAVHISYVNDDTECDAFFPDVNFRDLGMHVEERTFHDGFFHEVWTPDLRDEDRYLEILGLILTEGSERETRNGKVKSLFGANMQFNLQNGFPLLTTKKMFMRGVVEELLFFIRGDTDSKILEEKGVNIWKGNTSREFLDNLGMTDRPVGVMGPMYGYQWRHYNAPYDQLTGKPLGKGIDQLKSVIDLIRTDPMSRRIVMTDFNPSQADQGVLYPCHSLIVQFYVDSGFLDMVCYNRSQDFFLGVPFNIASSALLLTLVAKATNLVPRNLGMNMGDVHVYADHYQQAFEQVDRLTFPFPSVRIDKSVSGLSDLETLTAQDIVLVDYKSHGPLHAKMVA
jgi:dihydrofolate reductase/thymidylate synthase